MAPTNDQLALAFDELADLSEITGADRFRVLAYRRAAATLRGLVRNAASMPEAEISRLQGIGKATAAKIRELSESGRMAKLEALRASVPPGVRQMTEVAGLGPKRAMLLFRRLGIETLDDLRAAGAEVVEAIFVDDGDIVTAGGVTSGLDLALHLVEREWGRELAVEIATLMEHERRGPVRVTVAPPPT